MRTSTRLEEPAADSPARQGGVTGRIIYPSAEGAAPGLIPQKTFVIFDTVFLKQKQKLRPETYPPVMPLLILNVLDHTPLG